MRLDRSTPAEDYDAWVRYYKYHLKCRTAINENNQIHPERGFSNLYGYMIINHNE